VAHRPQADSHGPPLTPPQVQNSVLKSFYLSRHQEVGHVLDLGCFSAPRPGISSCVSYVQNHDQGRAVYRDGSGERIADALAERMAQVEAVAIDV
jgi:hypothetical protein